MVAVMGDVFVYTFPPHSQARLPFYSISISFTLISSRHNSFCDFSFFH
jgi:hypothetical protein